MQQEFGQLTRQKLQPALEKLFDRFAGSEELIRLDRLELDLGTVDNPLSEGAIVKAIVQGLEEKLLQQITYSNREVDRITVQLDRFDQWLFFLEKGHLPMMAAKVQEEELHAAVLQHLSEKPNDWLRLEVLVYQQPIALDRLVKQHAASFLVKLLAATTGHQQQEIPSLLEELSRLVKALTVFGKKQKAIGRPLKQNFWKWAFSKDKSDQSATSDAREMVVRFFLQTIGPQYERSRTASKPFNQMVLEVLHSPTSSFPLLTRTLEKRLESKNSTLPDAPASEQGEQPVKSIVKEDFSPSPSIQEEKNT